MKGIPRRTLQESVPEPLKVAFVVHEMRFAGVELLVARIIRSLGPRIKPLVVCLDDIGALGTELAGEGVTVVSLDRQPGIDFGCIARMARILRRQRVDVVHAQQYSAFFYAVTARPLSRVRYKTIMSEHGRPSPDVVAPRRRLTNKLLYQHLASAVTSCSDWGRIALAKNDGFDRVDIETVRNGVDVDQFTRSDRRPEVLLALGLDPKRRYVACIARLDPIKNHHGLLVAFAQVTAHLGDVDLLLVGEGSLRPRLQLQADELGIGDRVQFLGVRGDVPRLLSVVNLVVLLSASEAAPLCLIEAMAASCPIVATSIGGVPEIVKDRVHGLLVRPDDANAAFGAILEVLSQPELAKRLGAAGRLRVESDYQLTNMVETYTALYDRVAGRETVDIE